MHLFHKWRLVKNWQETAVFRNIFNNAVHDETVSIARGFKCDVCRKRKISKGTWFDRAPQRIIDDVNRWEISDGK